MKVSRGGVQAAPPAPPKQSVRAQIDADVMAQMLALIPGRPELFEENTAYTLRGIVVKQTYRSYADGMEYLITVENAKVVNIQSHSVGVR